MRWSDGPARRTLPGVAASAASVLGLLLALATLGAAPVLAATPAPTAGVGDPRSSGQGAGLVGDPLFAIAVVAGIAIVSLIATLVYVRATGGAGSRSGRSPSDRSQADRWR